MRQATIRTVHDNPTVVAAALEPDNTSEMSTHVEFYGREDATRSHESRRKEVVGTAEGDDCRDCRTDIGGIVETTIRRESTSGLRATVDDYVSNLQVAQRIINDKPNTNQ